MQWWTAALAAALVAVAADATACSGTPVSPQAIALGCAHPDEDDLGPDETTPELRVAVQNGWVAIRHELGSGGDLRRQTLAASIAWRPLDSIVLFGDVGAIVRGDITVADARHRVEAGPRGGLGIAWRAYAGEEWFPFISVGASFALLSSTTVFDERRERLTAFDFRTELVVGKLFDGIGPYLVGRTITGAHYWKLDGRARSAQPRDLYQFGLGLLASQGAFDAFAEVCPLGERSALFGLGYAF